MASNIVILQANLGRSRLATDEILVCAHTAGSPILLVQEPYARENVVAGMGKYRNRIITGNRADEYPWSCIVILDNNYEVVVLREVSTSHCVCAHVTGPLGSLYVISSYFQFSGEGMVHVNEIRTALRACGRGKRIIIGADVNGTSPTWNWRNGGVDERGREVEDLMAEENLMVANRPGQPCTYTRGNRDIDVTLASEQLQPDVVDWSVRDGWTSSDHRVISVTIGEHGGTPSTLPARYNYRRADWDAFSMRVESAVPGLMSRELCDSVSVSNMAIEVVKALVEAADKTIPKKKRFRRSVPWWSSELTRAKKKVNRLRRMYQRDDTDARVVKRARYNVERRKYTSLVMATRKTSWKKFVEEDSARDPYGLIYKMSNQKMRPDTVLSCISAPEGGTNDWRSTAIALLNGLFPAVEESNASMDQARDRCRSRDSQPWTEKEVMLAVRQMKNRKAPGPDMLEAELIKRAVQGGFREVLTKLYNGCLRHSVFPEQWRTGTIVVLLKGPTKDPTLPRSYRPICLLSILSKILERLIRGSLQGVVLHPSLSSANQFGYRTQRGTEDAIARVREIVDASIKNVIIGLLFDATGAFDHLRWSTILEELEKRECPRNLFLLVASYLSKRKVRIEGKYDSVERLIDRGCPQGSILGPDFWNVSLDNLLLILEGRGINVVAYADDLMVIIEGDSRREIERKGQEATDLICGWFKEQGLQVSQTKTEMIVLKDKVVTGRQVTKEGNKRVLTTGSMAGSSTRTGKGGKRPPSIKIEGKGMRCPDEVKYLGVLIGTRMSIRAHVRETGARGKRLYGVLASVARANWGIGFRALKVLYRGVFLAVATYAAGGWGDLVTGALSKSVQSNQRQALLRMSRSYSTTSTDALQVLNGEIPLDLMIKERYYKFKVRKKISFEYGCCRYDGRRAKNEAEADLRKETLRVWQTRWDGSTKGRLTYKYFPSVTRRMDMTWISPDYYTSQLLTGHGDFRAKLESLGLADRAACECGEVDDATHVLWHCQQFAEQRELLLEAMRERGVLPGTEDTEERMISAEGLFTPFCDFCRAVLKEREQQRTTLQTNP